MVSVANVYGVINAREAMVGGCKGVVTHRDPKTGDPWFEAYNPDDLHYDGWHRPEVIKF